MENELKRLLSDDKVKSKIVLEENDITLVEVLEGEAKNKHYIIFDCNGQYFHDSYFIDSIKEVFEEDFDFIPEKLETMKDIEFEIIGTTEEKLTKIGRVYDNNIYMDDSKYCICISEDESKVVKDFIVAKNINELVMTVEHLNQIDFNDLEVIEKDFEIGANSYFPVANLNKIGHIGCNDICLYKNCFLISLESLTLNGVDVENCLALDNINDVIETLFEFNNLKVFK